MGSFQHSIATERDGMNALHAALENGQPLAQGLLAARDLILSLQGRLVVTGVGKSGHVARKCASTLASTGTPSFFVHPTEASHGDLGMIQPGDAIFAMSWSGETAELEALLRFTETEAITLIGVTSGQDSTLATAADIALILPRVEEACPNGLAPTTSAIVQMALIDALAVDLLKQRNFSALDFRRFHPGGTLGAKLRKVGDVMRRRGDLPLAAEHTSLVDTMMIMSEKAAGCCGVIDAEGLLVGMITDGDLRRHFNQSSLEAGQKVTAANVMTKNPKVVSPQDRIEDLKYRMDSEKTNASFVVDGGLPVGLVTLRDLLAFAREGRS